MCRGTHPIGGSTPRAGSRAANRGKNAPDTTTIEGARRTLGGGADRRRRRRAATTTTTTRPTSRRAVRRASRRRRQAAWRRPHRRVLAPARPRRAPSESTAGTTPVTISSGERRPEDPPNPVQGGTLVYGLEADSANPWAPYRTSCVTSCLAVLRGISDSLFAVDADGQMVPYLVESVDHNADYTQWTLHIRDGITFHDGTPLDGAAVKFNIDTCRASPLTATAYLPDRHRRGVGPGRHDHPPRRPVDRAARVLRVRLVRLHVLAAVAGQPAGRAPAQRRSHPSTTRRWRRRRPTATRSSRSGSGRSCTSRTRRATATPSWPSATPTTGEARTGSPASSCRTSTRSTTSWPSTRTAAPTRSGRATSTS